MPYVYEKVDLLEGIDQVGSHHCAVLVQPCAKLPLMKGWKCGGSVNGNKRIEKRTAVATFVKGEPWRA